VRSSRDLTEQTGKTSLDRIVDFEVFEDFASHYRNYLNTATVTEQKLILQKFIRKVEVGVNTVKIHWIVDQDHFDRELALKRAGSRPSGADKFFKDYGSYTLTFGAHRGT